MEITRFNHVIHQVGLEGMQPLLAAFSEWHRLTGTPECEKASAYILERLRGYGIACERHEFDGYFSDPVRSELTLAGDEGAVIPSKPRSASAHCPDGVTGALVYDPTSQGPALSGLEEQRQYAQFRGKIVVSWNFYEDYVKKLEAFGALGLIHIWPSDEDVIHEETVGPIWGTPTLDNMEWLPALPVLGIRRRDGVKLLECMGAGPLRATLRSWVDYRVAKVSLPVAFIPGRTPEFILVSGHYDSWHEGITDNAVGNAVCLEIARVLAPLGGSLERGVRIAWWPGHSNGRYMGSAWYCDQFWPELARHCVAHLNIDSPGSQGGARVLPRTSTLEGVAFTAGLIERFLGAPPDACLEIPKGADQSFFGVDIPIHVMYKYEPLPENNIYRCPGSGGGWWWHSEDDRLDKVDPDLLLRDARLNLATVLLLAADPRLPEDFQGYFVRLEGILRTMDAHSDPVFDFVPIHAALGSLARKVERAMHGADDAIANRILKTVGGGLNRLVYTAGSRYDYDNTFPFKPFPGLHRVVGVFAHTTAPDRFLFARTSFGRQRNRTVEEIGRLERELTALRPELPAKD